MKKLSRYIKPFIGLFLAILVFLFIQAMSDLNLPNLMSDIVDVGLQNNGVETAVPDFLSEDAKSFISIFLSDDEQNLINENYELGSTDSLKERKDFSNVKASNALFLKQNLSEATTKKLEDAFGNATWTFMYFLQDNTELQPPSDISDEELEEELENELDISNVDITKMYEAAPMLMQIKQAGGLEDYYEKAKNTEPMIKNQSSVKFAQLFYAELGADMDTMQRSYIIKVGLKMLGVTLISVLASISVGFISSRTASSITNKIRNDLFEKIEAFSLEEYSKFSSSSLMTRLINDLQQIFALFNMAPRMIFYAPVIAIGGVIMILQTNVSILWIILVPIAVLITMFVIVYKVGLPKFSLQQKIIDKINKVSRESLSGMMVVRAFGNEKFEENRFDEVNEESKATDLFVGRMISIISPVVMLVMNLTTVLIIWVSSNKIANSTLQVGDMIAFIQYAMQIVFSFIMIAMIFVFIPRANVSAERINEVFDEDIVIKNPQNPKAIIEDKKGFVEFDNVSFRYSGAQNPVLHNITFTARPGETVAFIGSTGSGKSTLINLVPRLFDVTEGSVKVNGVDVREQNLIALRDSIGYVAQENILLSGTIESNLKYGNPNATKEDMEKAIEVSQTKDFMDGLDDPYNYIITQGATNVSGGQRQRLSIARALTKNAPVYIFDDSFSALDFKTDANLRKALSSFAKNSAVLVVAQRVSSIMTADQIIVLENGKMVGKGKHKELLKTCKTYLEIAKSQLREEEL